MSGAILLKATCTAYNKNAPIQFVLYSEVCQTKSFSNMFQNVCFIVVTVLVLWVYGRVKI